MKNRDAAVKCLGSLMSIAVGYAEVAPNPRDNAMGAAMFDQLLTLVTAILGDDDEAVEFIADASKECNTFTSKFGMHLRVVDVSKVDKMAEDAIAKAKGGT